MIAAWRQGRTAPSWKFHGGLLLAGWGVFNLVEGLIDHHLLGVHHVRDDLGAPLSWDIGFLVLRAAARGGRLGAAARGDQGDGGPSLSARGCAGSAALHCPPRAAQVRYRRCVMPRSGSGSSAVWRLCLLGVTLLVVNDGRCRPTEL